MCDTSVTALDVFQDTVSVHRPSFYADRFLKFMGSTVFRKLHRKTPHDAHLMPRAAIPANISTVSPSLSFARSLFQEEEGFALRREVGLAGGSLSIQGGEEGGEESPEHGTAGHRL